MPFNIDTVFDLVQCSFDLRPPKVSLKDILRYSCQRQWSVFERSQELLCISAELEFHKGPACGFAAVIPKSLRCLEMRNLDAFPAIKQTVNQRQA